jgi:Arc/MetJ-type ribon-helix-helix transcriptional regulator
MTNVLQSASVADRVISVRLDGPAQRALEQLTEAGATQSEAIRSALVEAAGAAWRDRARSDASRLGADPVDRAEVRAVRELLEELAPPR